MSDYGDVRSCKVSVVAAQWISTGELAELLAVSTRTIERWVEEGLIEYEYRTPGGHYRFDGAKVLKKLRDQRQRDE